MKKNDGILEYKDSSFLQLSISWFDMEFIEFIDSIGISRETVIVSSKKAKKNIEIVVNCINAKGSVLNVVKL